MENSYISTSPKIQAYFRGSFTISWKKNHRMKDNAEQNYLTGNLADLRHLQEFFFQAPAAIAIVHGPEHVYSFSNSRYEQLFNRSRKELLGRRIRDVFPEIAGQGVYEIFRQVFESGEAFTAHEYHVNFKRTSQVDFEDGYFNFIAHPIKDHSGSVTDIMIHAFEITEQVLAKRQLEESEVHFRRMADLMPAKITNNDTQGRAIYFNQAWLDFSGISEEEMKNRSWDQTVHPDDLPVLYSKWKHSLETGEEHEAEFRILNKNNEYIWQLTRGVPVKDGSGKIEMWITTTTDIQKLKEEEKRKEEFLKMVSHELKTPITSVKGYVQLLLTMLNSSKVDIPASLPINSSLERIDQQVNRITRLISEMLDLSRIENNKLDLRLENFSINELVDETVQDILYTNRQLKIKVIHDFSCRVNADKDRIGQVLINFVTNAVKYSSPDQEVRMRISRGNPGEVAVSIEDRGIGIAQEDLERIFQRFYRSEKINAETYSGFGIGLFLAKEIVERHQGRVLVESELGQGSIFSFVIPWVSTG